MRRIGIAVRVLREIALVGLGLPCWVCRREGGNGLWRGVAMNG
jgi:hypothetical protein